MHWWCGILLGMAMTAAAHSELRGQPPSSGRAARFGASGRQPERTAASPARLLQTNSSERTGSPPPWQDAPTSPGAAFLASAILPGSGQWLLSEDRWLPYLLVEAWGWATYLDKRGEASAYRDDYRDLAWAVARRISLGERRDTVFEYYETLSQWQNSGAYDVDPRTSGIQPETDASTFNGDVWRLARALLIPGGATAPPGSPEYERALRYYLDHAVPAGYAWAWGPNGLEQQRFRELIRASDEASRSATLRLGILLANHVIAAVDALVIARVREGAGGDGIPDVRLHSRVRPHSSDGWRWTAGIRIAH